MRTFWSIVRILLALALAVAAFAFLAMASGAEAPEWAGLAGFGCLVSASLLWATVRPDDGHYKDKQESP